MPIYFVHAADMNSAFYGLYTPVSHVPVVDSRQPLSFSVDELPVSSPAYFGEIAAGPAHLCAEGRQLTSLLGVPRPL